MNTSPTLLQDPPPKTERLDPPAAAAAKPRGLHLARILVPIDFSPHAKKALEYAVDLATKFGAEITLLHVLEQLVYPGEWLVAMPTTSSFVPETRRALEEKLEGMMEDQSVKKKITVRMGRAWQEIVEFAKERGSDLIVMGTHGYTGVQHVLLGSVAEKVLRHAPCPVLSIRADAKDFA